MESGYRNEAEAAICELLANARLEAGDIVVVGCSTSEVAGRRMGTYPGPDIARQILSGLLPPLREAGIYLAAQCCEHLERALVVEADAMKRHGLTRVNAVPQPKAGGSFATGAFGALEHPVLVRRIVAGAGLDIGGTLIGMHLREVVVPMRLGVRTIGEAPLSAARTRPGFVGGSRAVYDSELM